MPLRFSETAAAAACAACLAAFAGAALFSTDSAGELVQPETGLRCAHEGPVSRYQEDPVAEGGTIVERAEMSYRQLRSYADRAVLRHESESSDSDTIIQCHETSLEFRFAPPNLVVLRNDRGGVYCDGVRLWLHDAVRRVYTESAAPSMIDLDDLDRRVPAVHLASHPIARLFLGGATAPQAWGIDRITGWSRAPRVGVPGCLVRAVGRGDIPGRTGCAMSFWFNDRSGTLEEIVVDQTAAFHEANPVTGAAANCGTAELRRVIVTAQLTTVRVNEPVTTEMFVFRPVAEDRRVGEILSPLESARDTQASMVGHRAPHFQRHTLNGELFSLSQAAGQVVVLYFWDSGCEASVDGLSGTNAFAQRFLGLPVTVLGVNQDRPGSAHCVRRVTARAEGCMVQLMDGEGDLARMLALTGVPCTVLIDQHGVVRAIDHGEPSESIASRVKALLGVASADWP